MTAFNPSIGKHGIDVLRDPMLNKSTRSPPWASRASQLTWPGSRSGCSIPRDSWWRGDRALPHTRCPTRTSSGPASPSIISTWASEYPQIVAAIEDFKPTALIGVSTVSKLFSHEIVAAMTRLNTRPIIFALSNPVEKHECLPEDAYAWSGGQAVYAGGVQFPPVHLDGQTFLPSQANNLYIFPAVGMAVYATNARRVTDEMFIEAAHAVADQVTPEQLKLGMLFPPQSDILEVEIRTAARVARLVFDSGLARVERPADMEVFIRHHLYKPEYKTLV